MGYQEAGRLPSYRHDESDSGATVKILALFLGLLVGVLSIVSVLMWASARDARTDAKAATAAPSTSAMAMPEQTQAFAGVGAVPTPSFAGLAPANAAAVSLGLHRHDAVDADVPPRRIAGRGWSRRGDARPEHDECRSEHEQRAIHEPLLDRRQPAIVGA